MTARERAKAEKLRRKLRLGKHARIVVDGDTVHLDAVDPARNLQVRHAMLEREEGKHE